MALWGFEPVSPGPGYEKEEKILQIDLKTSVACCVDKLGVQG